MTTLIKLRYSSIDRFSKTATFKTLKGARKFAWNWVGRYPEMGGSYVVTGDGVGKLVVREGLVEGKPLTWAMLFPSDEALEAETAPKSPPADDRDDYGFRPEPVDHGLGGAPEGAPALETDDEHIPF